MPGSRCCTHLWIELGLSAMAMAFIVNDPAMLDIAKPGQQVRFATDSVDGRLTVVRLEPTR